jgi:hypothetical protein
MDVGARRSLALAIFVASGLVAGTWACGSATGLDDLDAEDNGSSPEGGADGPLADSPRPPPPDDVTPPPDDVRPPPEDAPFDVVPPFDVSPPPFDAPFDVSPPDDVFPFDVSPPPFDVFPFDAPFDVGPPPPPWDGGTPVAIATDEEPVNLALDGTYVYWENGNGSAVDCPLAGCPSNTPTVLTFADTGYDSYQSLAVAIGSAFFIDQNYGISYCAGGGCDNSPTPYTTGEGDGGFGDSGTGFGDSYEYLVIDSSNVYFTDDTNIYSCPIGASCDFPTTLYSSEDAYLGPLGFSSSEVYFADDGPFTSSIRAVPIGGGTARRVCTSDLLQDVVSLVVTPAYVYFTTYSDPNSVYQCGSGGGTSPTVYATDENPYGLATDGTYLYWTNNVEPGAVVACALGATCESPNSVATNQNAPNAIAVNSTNVYWTTASAVYRASKP